MKRTKLLATLCTLILTIACLTFGVYSAVKTTFTASGTITFNAYGIDIDVKGTITGTKDSVADFMATSTYSTTEKSDSTRQSYNSDLSKGWTFGNLEFDELDDTTDNKITIKFEIINYSGFAIQVNVEDVTSSNFDISAKDITYISKYDQSVSTLPNKDSLTITILPKNTLTNQTSQMLDFRITAQASTLAEATLAESADAQGLHCSFSDEDSSAQSTSGYMARTSVYDSDLVATITKYDGDDTMLVIPSTVQHNGKIYKTELNAGVVDYDNNIFTAGITLEDTVTTLIVPGNIATIPNAAFFNSKLQTVIISNGIKSIETCAFATIDLNSEDLISELNTVILPETLNTIGGNSFLFANLTQITIPSSVTSIGNGAFVNCQCLTTVIFEENSNLATIGQYAFFDCTSLTSITIPSRVTSIGECAFDDCSLLFEVYNLTGKEDFNSCFVYAKVIHTSLDKPTCIRDLCGIKYYVDPVSNTPIPMIIPDKSIVSATLLDGCTEIPDKFFSDCTSLTSITIPSSVTTIGDYAFKNCTSLKTLTIADGSKLESVGRSAFEGCANSKSVYVSDLKTWLNIKFVFSDSPDGYDGHPMTQGSGKLYINNESVENIENVVVPDGVTEINACAFYGWNSLKSITIPSSVTTIGDYAFVYGKFKTITFEDNSQLTTINHYAFFYCRSLTSITIPSSVTSIGYDVFMGCDSLTSIYLSSSVGSNPIGKTMLKVEGDETITVTKWCGRGHYWCA